MPNTFVQFEQRLEPFVEGFDSLTASRVQPFAALALVELATLLTEAVRLVARWLRFLLAFLLRVSSIFRAEKTPARAMALVFPFHFFCHVVAIVTTVGQHMLGFLRQVIDFWFKRGSFFRACRVHRGQQRKDRTLFGGRDDDLEAVTLHPAVMYGTTPRTIAVDAPQTLGNAVFLPITLVPQGTTRGDQTLVDCHAPRVGDPFATYQLVVEATASYEWFVQLVEPTADRVVLAHPGHLRVIAQSKRKTDKLDAQTLAEFLALDQIPEAWRPTPRVRQHRTLVRHRQYVVAHLGVCDDASNHLTFRIRVSIHIRPVLCCQLPFRSLV